MYIVNTMDEMKGNVILGVENICCKIGPQSISSTCFILKPNAFVKDADFERGIGFFNLFITEHEEDDVSEKMEPLPSFFQYYCLLSSPKTQQILKEKYGFECTDPNILMDLDDKMIEGINETLEKLKIYEKAKEEFQRLSCGIDVGW